MPRGFGRLPFLHRRSGATRSDGPLPALPGKPVDAELAAVGPPVLLPAMIYREILFDASEMTPAWARPKAATPAASPAASAPSASPAASAPSATDTAPPDAPAKPKRQRRPRTAAGGASATPATGAAPDKPKRTRRARPLSS